MEEWFHMKNAEKLHQKIVDVMEETNENIIDAIIHFCSVNELDIEDVIKQCDEVIIERLKKCAISENMLRRSFIRESTEELYLE